MALAFAWLAGGGILVLPGAFALWLLATVATLRRQRKLWPVAVAVPALIYTALLLVSLFIDP